MAITQLDEILSKMHPTQITWAKAKALQDCLSEELKRLTAKRVDDKTYEKVAIEGQQARYLFKLATVALLEFGRLSAKKACEKFGKPFTPELEKLYSDDVLNYLNIDILPNRWQSNVIDSIMRLDHNSLR